MRHHPYISLVFSLLVSIEVYGSCPRNFSMAHSGDYVPYQYTSEKGQLVGMDVDIAIAVTKLMGCTLSLRELPAKRAQHLLKEGELDLMAAASITSERHQYAHFSLPYRDEKVVLFVRQDRSIELQGLTLTSAVQLGLKIGAGLGGWYGIEYQSVKEQALSKKILLLKSSTEQRIKMLVHELLDVAVADLYVGYFHGAKYQRKASIESLPHVLNNDPVHFMLSRKTVNGEQLDAFNQALTQFIKSDHYQKLIQRYQPNI